MCAARTTGISFNGYMHNSVYNKDIMDADEIKHILERFKAPGVYYQFSLPMFYMVEYATLNYLVFTENTKMTLGYDAREFLEGGLPRALEIWNKDDFRVFSDNIFVKNTGMLTRFAQEQHSQLIFSHTYRVANSKGVQTWIYEQGSYITSPETGLPLYALGVVTDISLIKRDNCIPHSIHLHDEANGNKLLDFNYFYPNPDDAKLTRRETEVLKWMAEGFSSKQIADQLHNSESTIVIHRKNMLRKMNCKNVAELVAKAIRGGII